MHNRAISIAVIAWLLVSPGQALAYCGNGIVDADEQCDDGGTCIGGSNAGSMCTADAQCMGPGVCIGGDHNETICVTDPDCPYGICRRCVPFGGDGCAANCTVETDVPFLLDSTSNATIHTERSGDLQLSLTGSVALSLGQPDAVGNIPFVIKAGSVELPKIGADVPACACIREIAAKSCGGTVFEPDGALSADCTPGYTDGDVVCPPNKPCAFIHGAGNSAAGVIGCSSSGLEGTNFNLVQDSRGSEDPAVCAAEPGLGAPICAAGPILTLSGHSANGAAVAFTTQAIATSWNTCPPEFCTEVDSFAARGTPMTTPLVTSTATGMMLNINGEDGRNLGPFSVTGSPFACGGSGAQVHLGSVLTAPNQANIGDVVVTTLFAAPIALPRTAGPTPTGPTRTKTVTTTRPPTPTRTPTRTITATPTPTITRTPVPNVRQLSSSGHYTWAWLSPRITDDGSLVVYSDGINIRAVGTDGSDRRTLTSITGVGGCSVPYPSAGGDQVVMICGGKNGGAFFNNDVVLLDHANLIPVTALPRPYYSSANHVPSISADGQTIAFSSTANYSGHNADASEEIFLWHSGDLQMITDTATGSTNPSISADGHRVAYERSGVAYVYDDQAGEIPITRSFVSPVQFSRDGQWVVFRAKAFVLGSHSGIRTLLYRHGIGGLPELLSSPFDPAMPQTFATNADATRTAAVSWNRSIGRGVLLTPAGPRALPGVPSDATWMSFDAAGHRLAFASWENLSTENPRNDPQVFVADIPDDPGPPPGMPTQPPPAGTCTGDCGDDGNVTVNEIVSMVSVALGAADVSMCAPGDSNDDNRITVNEILQAVNNALNRCVPDVKDPIEQGLTAFAAGDVQLAKDDFCQAAADAPGDNRAKLLCAATGTIANVITDPSLVSLAARSGVSLRGNGHDLCNWRAVFPYDSPAGAPTTGEIVATIRDVLLREIDAATSTLQTFPDDIQIPFNLRQLPWCMRPPGASRIVEIDHTDLLAAAAALKALRASVNAITAYDLDVDLASLVHESQQDVLAHAPNLLTLLPGGSLSAARQDADEALAALSAAINAALAETDDQSDDLLVIAPGDRAGAARMLQLLSLLRQSLLGEVVLSADVGLSQPFRLNLSLVLSGQITSLRPFLGFKGNGRVSLTHFPDPTFGGIAPDLTQLEIDRVFFGRHCWRYFSNVPTQADCDALSAEYQCGQTYFSPGSGSCSGGQCICEW